VRLTAWEEERLLIFAAAELARRHRSVGLRLNAPEAIAMMCDAMLEAARAGRGYAEVEAAGYGAVSPDEVIDGVRELVDDVRLEVLLDDGARLIVLVDPLRRGGRSGSDAALGPEPDAARGPEPDVALIPGPGAIRPSPGEDPAAEGEAPKALPRIHLEVRNGSRRVIRVSSHFPFDRVNARLEFDRAKAAGSHLDIDAGSSVRWAPGETKTVPLVRFGGTGT